MKNCHHPRPRFEKKRHVLIIGLAITCTTLVLAALVSGSRNTSVVSLLSEETASQLPDTQAPISSDNSRGTIYDINFNILASSYKTKAVYARPLELEAPEKTAKTLAAILGLNEEKLLSTLKAERSFVWLCREIETTRAEKVSSLNINGIYLVDEMNRYYPNGPTFAHAVGFAANGQGLDGLEFYYNNILHSATIEQADLTVLGGSRQDDVGSAGLHLIASLDLNSQELLEQYLKKILKKTKASSGMAALMSPKNGALVALVNLPAFDPNRFWKYKEITRKNRFITDEIFQGGLEYFFHETFAFPERKKSALKNAAHKKPPEPMNTITPEKQKKTVINRKNFFDHEKLARIREQLDLDQIHELDLPLSNDISPAIKKTGDPVQTLTENAKSTVYKTTAFQLLSNFTFLVNGGRKIKPHLLSAVLDQATGRQIPTHVSTSEIPTTRPALRPLIKGLLKGLGTSGPSDSLLWKAFYQLNQ